MCKKNKEKEYIENKYEFLTKDEKQKQKYKIIKNNIEKIGLMNKNKK